jgi:transposase
MATIIKRKIAGGTYYYLSHSYRAKEPGQKGKGRVKTKQVYLGTAEDVLQKITQMQVPESLVARSFGIEAAALQVVRKLDLVNIIDRHVEKRQQGLSVGQYLAVAAINRLVKPSSKNGIADWCKGSVLPDLMKIDPGLLKSQNFWDAFDKMLSEHKNDKPGPAADDQNPLIDDQIILDIELDIWKQLSTVYNVSLDPVLYDATNYFTFQDPQTPGHLTRFAKSKDGKNGQRCIGLALGQTLADHLPLFHLAYAANCHDARLFPTAIHRLTDCFAKLNQSTEGVILVMDKGNNSMANIQDAVSKRGMTIVGSLVPSRFLDLMRKQLRSYQERARGLPVYREQREVFGIPCVVVMTYNAKLRTRQLAAFEARLAKAESRLQEAIAKHGRKESKEKMRNRLDRILRATGTRTFLQVDIQGRRHKSYEVTRVAEAITERRRRMGKNVMFSTDLSMTSETVVGFYRERDRVEKTFRLSKDPSGVPFRPMHHWTDSKIRVFCFTCVLALLIWRLLHLTLARNGMKVSDKVLHMELDGIREITMLYPGAKAVRSLVDRSEVQKSFSSILGLNAFLPAPPP